MLEYINKYFLLLVITLGFIACEKDDPITDIIQFPRVIAEDSQGQEDAETLEAKVRLSWPYDQVVRVDYIIQPSAADTLPLAEMDEDYVAISGTLEFQPGDTLETVSIPIIADIITEDNEYFEILISNAELGVIIKSTGLLLIQDDDEGFFIDDTGPNSPESYPGMELVWEEQFDGSAIDEACWTHEIGNNGWGNNELQDYTASTKNSFQTGGYLVIEAKEEASNGSNYSSARMITAGKKEFKYGRIDIRAKLPTGRGIWPALWMLGSNFWDEGWPQCGEIDIMELIGHQDNIVYGTAHYGENPSSHNFMGGQDFLIGESFSDIFHVYSILWDEDLIIWYRDGIEFFRLQPDDIGSNPWPFNEEFFFIFNIAVGGDWPGSPDQTTLFPQRLVVDYIRVFQN